MDYAASRHNMVEGQIKTNRVTDPLVIEAMSEVPREAFVCGSLKSVAYIDDALSIGEGREMLEPMAYARMLEEAQLKETDIVLDIGCGTGYSSALLAKIVNTVVGVECNKDLAAKATSILGELGVDNAVVIEGDLKDGYPKQAPYDVIFYNGGITEVPQSAKDQLVDGGRLVCALDVNRAGVGTIVVVTKSGDVYSQREVFEAGVPLLPGFETKKGFVF